MVAKQREEEVRAKMDTSSTMHLAEGTSDDQEEGQTTAASEFTMEGLTGVGSEMDRVHIAERNKAMAAKLAVSHCAGDIGWCNECLHSSL